LAWDSKFFGYEVGKTILNNSQNLCQWTHELNKFQLVYIYSKEEIINHLPQNILHVGTQVMLKRQNVQSIEPVPIAPYSFDHAEGIFDLSKLDIPRNASQVRERQAWNTLTALAIKSGAFSRFNTDWRFQESEFKKLYTQWIQNALTGRDRILVYCKDNKIRGFISFLAEKEKGRIGLMAVDELFRRKEIG